MMSYAVVIENTQETFHCHADEDVLKAMERLQRKGIPVGCRNGGCGVCKVHVKAGSYSRHKMSRAVCTADEEAEGIVLACRIQPQSDLTVKVVGKMARAVEARRSASYEFVLDATQGIKSNKEN